MGDVYYLDYSSSRLSGEVIRSQGYRGCIRYIDARNRLRTKHTNLAEYQDHIANGLDIRLVMQNLTTDADGGFPVGRSNGFRALDGSKYLGYEKEIYFTNDRPTLPNPTRWVEYLSGAASAIGWDRVGAYGFSNAMDVAVNMTPTEHFWAAGRRSDVNKRPYVNFWQDNNTQVHVGGVLCDRNLVLRKGSFNMTPEQEQELLYKVHQLWDAAAQTWVQNKNQWIGTVYATLGKYLPTPADSITSAGGLAKRLEILEASLASKIQEYLDANPPVVQVDIQAIAKAVNDDFAARMKE